VIALVLLATALAVVLAWREATWRGRIVSLEEKLGDTRRQLAERNDLVNVGQLVSGLAQELKSPLQNVLGNTELVLASAPDDGAAAEELRDIRENAARAAGIIRNLLALSDTTALVRRWQDLNEIVQHASESRRASLEGAGVRLDLEYAERLPLVYIDGRQIEKVVATFLGDELAEGSTPSRIRIATRRDGERLTIEIEEVGAPVADDDKAAWSGELAACHRVLDAHGGALRVENGPFGARVRIDLPIAAGAPATLS
jgi:signal transduction histidine kinase